ncbi:(2,3-dihydroxybenzoyl)adenylate synthase [Micromonospora andamanensis]|uniref:2,3-dihydroxybenzoate-AMP ligase n=1 Tax=Micromonospora andamanensis TaxID=1287068 RepID=A0ABQ4I220_9ACTN|nr:AMP-binding protein [Micromonospora andamanensis]GIJ11907.1 2,3-dihydroxybenzoate-AMP ligase [Micromonospora andamanensis]
MTTSTSFTPWPPAFASRYRAAGLWTGVTFGRLLTESAHRHGSRAAVVDASGSWTYERLDREAHRLAGGLHRLGIGRGDRVVVQLPNVGEFVVLCFALFRIGAVPVLAQPSHREHEIVQLCTQSDAVAYVVPDRHLGFDFGPLIERVRSRCVSVRHVVVHGSSGGFPTVADLLDEPVPLADPDPADVALLQLSGGSTSAPKLIPRTHDDYAYSVRASLEVCPLGVDDRYLTVLPVAHNFPLSSPGILGALSVGATVVMSPSPSVADTFALIEQHRVTVTAVVPPIARVWLEAAATTAYDLSSLRVLQVGGARLKPALAAQVRPVLGCQLQQVYGMAEGLVNYTRLDDPEDVVVGTQGRPMSPLDEIRIVDENDREVSVGEPGELLTRGPYTIRGYFRATEQNARSFTSDGYYRTGDIVRLLPSGNLVVVDRVKDVVNRGGEKVPSEEVEEQLSRHPGVRDVAIVGQPDDDLGERVCAFVVPTAEPPRIRELKRFLRDAGLAAYKIPERYVFVQSLPLTAIGKVSKKSLRARLVEPAPLPG